MRFWLALAVTLVLAFPASASAGRLIVTGHDADRRCALMDQECGFLKATIRYVRESSKPVLVLDHGTKQLAVAIRKAWTSGYSYKGPKVVVVDPRALKRGQISVKRYSVVAIASDASCGGCDLDASDAAAIARRKGDLQTFLSRGGGIFAGAGGTNARAYYSFAPIPPAQGPNNGPFELTPYGQRIGLKPADVTCCGVVNTFVQPDVGAMAVAAQTSSRVADTLIADGVVRRGKLVATTTIPAVTGQSFVVQPVSGTVLGHPPDDPVFRRITGAANLVLGWTLNVTQGRARLTTAAGSGADQQSVDAYEGFFQILQGTGTSPVTDLALRNENFDAVCGAGGVVPSRVARTSASTKSVRHLWATGKGKFRTVGRFAAAAVRGTQWRTDDRCDGTLITVKTGAVSVFDQTLKKTVVVTAGHSYLARAA